MNAIPKALSLFLFSAVINVLLVLCPKHTSAQISHAQSSFHRSFYLATHTNPNGLHQWVFQIATNDTTKLHYILLSLGKKFNLIACDTQIQNTAATHLMLYTRKQFTIESLSEYINQLQSYLEKNQLLLIDYGIALKGQGILLAKTIQSPFYGATIMNVSGQIVDRYGSGIAYSTVGLPNKLLATISNEYGKFTLAIPAQFITDTLMVVALGYDTARIVLDPKRAYNFVIWLNENIGQNEHLSYSKTKRKRRPSYIDHQKGKQKVLIATEISGFQIAKLFSFKRPVAITNIQVYLGETKNIPLKLRLHLYKYDDQLALPGPELLNENMIVVVEGGYQGWVSFNLESNPIHSNTPIIAAVEWLDEVNLIHSLGIHKRSLSKCFELHKVLGTWMPTLQYSWAISMNIIRL